MEHSEHETALLLDVRPLAHILHAVFCSTTSEYVFARQIEQLRMPSSFTSPNLPGVHGRQNALPASICSNPNGQTVHEFFFAIPTPAENLPILHGLQARADAAASVDDHCPDTQFKHLESLALPFSLEYVPGIHGLHATIGNFSATPSLSENRPLLQLLQPESASIALVTLPYLPRGQAEQLSYRFISTLGSVKFLAWYPGRHSSHLSLSRSAVNQPIGQLLQSPVLFFHLPGSHPGHDVSPSFLAFMHGKQLLPSAVTGLYVNTGHTLQLSADI